MAANNTLGLNIELPIYNQDGTPFHGLVLRKSTSDSIVMSLGDKITGDVYYKNNKLAVTMQEYVVLDDVKYVLVTPPTVVREGMVSDNSQLNGMTKYSFVFYHPMYQLGNFPFTDIAVTQDQTKFLSESKKFNWIGYPDDYIAKLNKNLEGTEWIVEKSSRFPQDMDDKLSEVIPFDGATVADAIKTGYDTWGVPYVVGKVESTEASYAQGKRFKVIFGLPSNEIYEDESHRQLDQPFVFQFGQGVGLKNNSRTPRNNKIITRIAGYGSEDNIPYGYPQIPWYGNQAWDYTINNDPNAVGSYPIYKGIVGGAYVKLIKHPFTRTTLMPSVYSESVFNKVSPYLSDGTTNPNYNPNTTLKDYYDAIPTQEYPYPNPIVVSAPSYESHQFEDIKPELGQDIAIVNAWPINDDDQQQAASWDDSVDDGGNYKQGYFKVKLPILSFDLYACAAITQEMKISMRSGACLGCTFTVQVNWDDYKNNFYTEDGEFAPTGSQRDYEKYPDSTQTQVEVILQKETQTFGTLMPNSYQYPVAGDTFVVLGISLPLSYITNAEVRLDGEMKSYMLENNVHYYDYPLKFDEAFLRNNTNILSQIKPNTVIRFKFGDDTLQLFVKQLTVKYGEKVLPQYDITLTDNVEVVLNQIGRVADDVEKLSSLISVLRQNYNRNVWTELAKKLSKTNDDTAQGFIRFLKGLQVGEQFVPDILGEGGIFRKREDGKVELVTDILYARVKAYFDSVEIREYQHTAGNRIASVAGNKICRVAWFNSSNVELEQTQANLASVAYFRCYFRADDGEDTVMNNWVLGDQAYCHITSVTTSTDNPEQKGLNQKHLWRLVVGRNTEGTLTDDGEAWIDLSNRATETISGRSYTGYQSGSDIPEAQDDIIQLGNVNDTTRQGAIVEYVTGTNAPSYQIYQGINSFSLNGKNQIGFGYNTATGKAYLNVFGDAFIGDHNRSTYIEYKQNGVNNQPELNIKARVTFTNPSSELDEFVQSHQRDDSYDDTEVRADIATLDATTEELQRQIDGAIETYFRTGVPTLSNLPASEWTTDDEKDKHIGDLYYDKATGHGYRFMYDDETHVYKWTILTDEDVTEALRIASKAQATADGKRTVYSVWNAWVKDNVNTLEVGDLFIPAADTTQGGKTYKAKKVYKCTTEGSATFEEIAYTDDTRVNGFINELLNGQTDTEAAMTAAIKAIRAAVNDGETTVSGGLILTNEIAMRDTAATPKVRSGISGMFDANAAGGGIASWWGGARVDHEVSPSVADYAKSLVRFDGSGYFASGNITWDSQGRVAIKDITTLIAGSDTNVLNALTTFNNAFHFETQQGTTTVLAITPQVGFTELKITENGALKPVATQEWVNGNYVSISFFERLFNAYNGSTKVSPNSTATIDNIKAMFGFWTEQYISALGKGEDESHEIGVLNDLNDVIISSATANQILVFDGTHWRNQNQQSVYELPVATTTTLGGIMLGYAASGKNYAIQLDANGKAYVNVPWSDTTYTLPTASADTLGGVKIGSTLAIASGVLNLPTTGVTAGTYKRVTVDAYGRVTSGDNSDADTNTWRNIYTGGTSRVGTGIDTKAINFVAGSNVSISYEAAGTGSGQSGNANYFNIKISATDTTYSAATQSAAGLMSAADKMKLDGVATGANNYSLPLAANGTRGGVQVGYTTSGKNYAVQLSGEKMYVNVPWENTWRGIQDNLTSDSTTDSLSAYQGKLLNLNKLGLSGGTLTGTLTTRDVVVQSAYTLKIGDAILKWDSTNNALKLYKLSGSSEVAVNFYATGGVSALGQGSQGGGGGGSTTLYGLNDVSKNAAGDGVLGAENGYVLTYNGSTNHWYAAPTPETYVLPTATAAALGGIKIGYTTSGKNYAIQLDTNGRAFVNVPWENTWRGMQNNLTTSSSSTSDSLSAYQGYLLANGSARDNTKLPLSGGTMSGSINMGSNSITNLGVGGGIYWNPYVESSSDGTDAASIYVKSSGVAGGTTLVISQQNDSNDTIQFVTNSGATLYHNSNAILTSGNYANYVTLSALGIASANVNYANSAGSVAWTNVSGRPSSMPASDVYAWAKASTKPSYHAGELGITPTSYKVTNVSAGIAPYISDIGTNIFAGATTSEIKVERSTDNGSTWTDVTSAEASNVKNVFSGCVSGSLTISNRSKAVVGDRLRITFNPSGGSRYCTLAFIYVYFSTNGCACYCDVEKNYYTNQTSWYSHVTDAPISGWSGPNVIGMGSTIFGQNDSRNDGYGIRMTFRITAVSADYDSRGYIYSIQGFTANKAWGTPANSIAKTNAPYTFLNADRAVQFDNSVTASGFIKSGSSDDYFLLGGGGHVARSNYVAITSSNRAGVTKLFRRDDNSNYSVQTDWTGTYWRLRGYSGDTYHAGCQVAYADSAGAVAWGNVSSKPAAAGGATTPVYWTGSGFTACTAYSSASVNYANYAGYLHTKYDGGVKSNPQQYFNEDIGLRVAMTGSWMTWSDTLWINGYSGGDVVNMCALHFARNGTPRMAITTQSNRATAYGTYYEVITSYNIASQSVNYATSAGNADTVDSEHASAFAHRAAGNNLVHAGNEITMIPDSFSGSLWLNYQSVGRNSSSNITEYIFGNGKGGQLAKITSENFSGNAASATKLQTARTIWGQSFDGTGSVNGLLYISANSNTTTIGSQNSSFCHIYNSTDVPFIFNKNVFTIGGLYPYSASYDIGSTSYRWGTAYVTGVNCTTSAYFCTSSGSVGIGTTSPSYKLHVAGDIYATGGVTSLSDARHKTIMGDTKLRVEQIAEMPAITYKWNDRRDNDLHVGSIAQNWQRILPEVVSVANDLEGTLSINYGVAAMIASIVTAKKVVDHEARIKALESENRELKEKLQTLQIA